VYVAVVGAGVDATEAQCALAEEVGALLAEAEATVVTGGLGGVMEAACRGARSRHGRTVGLLPWLDRSAANGWVEVAIPTGLGELRNGLVAVGGGPGTLSEIALALKGGLVVIGLGTWEVPGVRAASSAQDAVAQALAAPGRH
jgi:uncharacterized protein (TIGR00725 family)